MAGTFYNDVYKNGRWGYMKVLGEVSPRGSDMLEHLVARWDHSLSKFRRCVLLAELCH